MIPTILVEVTVPRHSKACKDAARAVLVGPGPKFRVVVTTVEKASGVFVTATRTGVDLHGTLGHPLGDAALVRVRVLDAVEAAYAEAEAVRRAKRRGLLVLPRPTTTTAGKPALVTAMAMFDEDNDDDTEEVAPAVVVGSPK